jgi:hypothetical protein
MLRNMIDRVWAPLGWVQTDRAALRHAEIKGAAHRSAAGLDDKPCIIAPDCATSNISEHDPESVGTSKESVRSCTFYLDGVLSTDEKLL